MESRILSHFHVDGDGANKNRGGSLKLTERVESVETWLVSYSRLFHLSRIIFIVPNQSNKKAKREKTTLADV